MPARPAVSAGETASSYWKIFTRIFFYTNRAPSPPTSSYARRVSREFGSGKVMRAVVQSGQAASKESESIRVMDYEDSAYRTEFWEKVDRRYEDVAERMVLRILLPPRGSRLVDIGGGFGRLGAEYAGYRQVVFFDYSRTMLAQAVERWGHDPRFVFVNGDVYRPPFRPGAMDTVIMIRVIHHLERAELALERIAGMLRPGGSAILEFANKRNLKAVGRHLLGRQPWSPHAREPVEFAEMNFNFHPEWIREWMRRLDLGIDRAMGVSHFRLPLLKQLFPPQWLARLDLMAGSLTAGREVAPSVFVHSRRQGDRAGTGEFGAAPADWLACPACGTAAAGLGMRGEDALACQSCGAEYRCIDGIWDFKTGI